MGPRRRIDRLFDCVLTKPTSRPLMWLYCADTRCRHANLLELTTNDLRSFLAMTSSMMPVIINSKPAITSMTAPISVGKRNTTPVFIKSTVTVHHNINPTRPRMKPTPPKNGKGLYSRIIRKIVLSTLMPSPTVSSLLTEPSGLSRY